MKILMYVAGMPFDGHTLQEIRDPKTGQILKPSQSLGGSETMGFYVARELAKRGHSVFCFCNVPDGQSKSIDNVQYLPIGQPSQQFPFGDNFEKYALSIPHDLLLGQRLPALFSKNFNSKLNYWWTHDLALYRNIQLINAQIWNIDRILGVSQFHIDQIESTYSIGKEVLSVLPNAVDSSLYHLQGIAGHSQSAERKIASKTMIYSSRPERGLELLVKEGGIMENLLKIDPEIQLMVCGYDHTTQEMAPMYNHLWGRCNALPNVRNVGPLSKQDLAQAQMNSWLHIYPSTFEETSCITAMEESFAGTPMVACEVGALPETLKDGGVYWSEVEKFEGSVRYLKDNPDRWTMLHKKALKKSECFTIENTVDVLEQMVDEDFTERTSDKMRVYNHLVYYSDVTAAKVLAEQEELVVDDISDLFPMANKSDTADTVDFYDSQAEYHVKIENKHNIGNHEVLLSFPRVAPVLSELQKLKPGSTVLDFGCCVGQNTFAFASAFPDLHFVGVDISANQIKVGQKYLEENKVENVELNVCTSPEDLDQYISGYDCVLCCEVLEHIVDYHTFLTELEKSCKIGGRMVMSTPFGPHDRTVENRTTPIEHVHHFEEQDLLDILCNSKVGDYDIIYARDPDNKWGEKLGDLVWSWNVTGYNNLGEVDYQRKFKTQKPRQTVSVCMIVGPDADTLPKTMKSVMSFADEFIVGVDYRGEGLCNAENVARYYGATTFRLTDSPSKVGFDYCRNMTLGLASKDWIVWIDDDETFQWPERLVKFLRHNEFDSYAIHQHHYTVEPPGVMKTDLPCRIFRNGKGISFFGLVHEHPEKAMNEGAGKSFLLLGNEVCIAHNGYDTEDIRRGRFMRNWPLMQKDRKENPNRSLGKYLWIRDLVHINRFELEQNGGRVSPNMVKNAKEALTMFRSLLDEGGNVRNIRDTIAYVSECVGMLTNGGGVEFRFSIDITKRQVGDDMNQAPFMLQGMLETKEDLLKLMATMVDEKLDPLEKIEKYI